MGRPRRGSEAGGEKERLPVARIIKWAGGAQAVADRMAEVEGKPPPPKDRQRSTSTISKWIKQDEAGRKPLHKAEFWRVWELSLMCGVPPWKLLDLEIPDEWLKKSS